MKILALEYAHKMWAHYAEYMQKHQRNTANMYLLINAGILAGLKALPLSGALLPFACICGFCATFTILLSIATLSSLFYGKGAPDPIDKFQELHSELQTDSEHTVNNILADYDRDIKILKKQTQIKGYLLRFQAGFSIVSMMMFFFVLL